MAGSIHGQPFYLWVGLWIYEMDRLEKSDFWQTSRVRKGTVSVNFILSVKKFKAGGALWAFFRGKFLSFFCFLSFPEVF
ncbi:MAG: hypothetical protein J6J31_03960 [Thermoguttaceae bacterium]|nr:hypothetical protein [Thermoguttaceae bacterium]